MKIFLLGLPGSGKSKFGKDLADIFNIPFIDLDNEIEKTTDRSVASIFQTDGEVFFRQVEAKTLDEKIIGAHEFIMATGGGTPCFYNGIEKMNKVGVTLFLDVSVEVIALRINDTEKNIRPLLSAPDESVTEILNRLRQQRLAVYQKSKLIAQGSDLTIDVMLNKIREILSKGNSESNLV